MAQKVSITLDANKLRGLISKRSYTNQQGENVEVQEVKFDLIEMKPESHKVVYSHEKFDLIKTHFAVQQQTSEDRDNNTPVNYIGEGISQVWKNGTSPNNAPPADHDEGDGLAF